MTTIARVTGGVDTHKDIHVAAALDDLGRLLGTASFPATRHGIGASSPGSSPTGPSTRSGSKGAGRGGRASPATCPPEVSRCSR